MHYATIWQNKPPKIYLLKMYQNTACTGQGPRSQGCSRRGRRRSLGNLWGCFEKLGDWLCYCGAAAVWFLFLRGRIVHRCLLSESNGSRCGPALCGSGKLGPKEARRSSRWWEWTRCTCYILQGRIWSCWWETFDSLKLCTVLILNMGKSESCFGWFYESLGCFVCHLFL